MYRVLLAHIWKKISKFIYTAGEIFGLLMMVFAIICDWSYWTPEQVSAILICGGLLAILCEISRSVFC